MEIAKSLKIITLVFALTILSGCISLPPSSTPATNDSDGSSVSNSNGDFAIEGTEEDFPRVITKCDHGNRLYYGGAYRAIAVAAADPTCPQPTNTP